METEAVIEHARSLIQAARAIRADDSAKVRGLNARVCDFLARFGGRKNPFLAQVQGLKTVPAHSASVMEEVLESFIDHMEAGLVTGLSPKRQAEIDVVSDFLSQADDLLQSSNVHPAAPAMIIGATLEEFLRTWIEDIDLSLGSKKPSLDSYSKVLREADLISKQDIKDITAWSGIRNNAAHGEWGELQDKARIQLMLEGVNLFMRRHV